MEDRRRILLAAGGALPPANLFSGGETVAISDPELSVPAIPVSSVPGNGKAVYFLGFTPAGSDPNGNNFCVYRYKIGFFSRLCGVGCALTARAVDGKNCFCFESASQGKLGLLVALRFSASEHAAETVLKKMSISYYGYPRSWDLGGQSAVQLRLPGELPAPGDLVFLVSRQLGALAPEGGDVFGAFRCGADGNKEHLCSDNKLIAADGTWGAVGCTASELSEYSDFSVYDPANAYARIYGVSFV